MATQLEGVQLGELLIVALFADMKFNLGSRVCIIIIISFVPFSEPCITRFYCQDSRSKGKDQPCHAKILEENKPLRCAVVMVTHCRSMQKKKKGRGRALESTINVERE